MGHHTFYCAERCHYTSWVDTVFNMIRMAGMHLIFLVLGCVVLYADATSPLIFPCSVDGKVYQPGETFTKGCERCYCDGMSYGGGYACLPICPLAMVNCGPGQVLRSEAREFVKGCICHMPYCADVAVPPPPPGADALIYIKTLNE